MSKTEEMIVTRYGVLLSIAQCAALFNRSEAGFRVTMSQDNALSNRLKTAKIRLGRRVMFKATEIARFLDEAQ